MLNAYFILSVAAGALSALALAVVTKRIRSSTSSSGEYHADGELDSLLKGVRSAARTEEAARLLFRRTADGGEVIEYLAFSALAELIAETSHPADWIVRLPPISDNQVTQLRQLAETLATDLRESPWESSTALAGVVNLSLRTHASPTYLESFSRQRLQDASLHPIP